MFIEFRDLEKLTREPKKFKTKYFSKIIDKNIDEAIYLLKLSGICVDQYASGFYKVLFEDVINSLKARSNENDLVAIDKLLVEVKLWNNLFSDIEHLRKANGLYDIIDDQKSMALFCSAEEICKEIINYSFPPEELPLHFSGTMQSDYITSLKRIPKNNISFKVDLFENLMSNLSLVYKFLNHRFSGTFNRIINDDDVKKSAKYFDLAIQYNTLNMLHEYWRYFNFHIKSESGILELVGDENIVIEKELNNLRYNNRESTNSMQLLTQTYNLKLNCNTNNLPPVGFISIEELESYLYFSNKIFLDNISDLNFDSVSTNEFIRAYHVIIEYAKGMLHNSTVSNPIILTKAQLSSMFKQRGINKENIATIIKIFTFDPKISSDFFDAPLIKYHHDSYLIFPFICANGNFANSFLSNLQSHKYDFSKTGKLFEAQLLSLFCEQNITAKRLHKKEKVKKAGKIIKTEEYECDICVFLDGVLYFIEAKIFYDPNNVRRHYEHYEKIIEAVSQIDRYYNYFSNNLDLVKAQIGIPIETCIVECKKVIVTSSFYSGKNKINDTYIVDYSVLHRFLKRKPFSLHEIEDVNGKMEDTETIIHAYEDIYSGNITNDKLIKLLEIHPPIIGTLAQLQFDIHEINILEQSIRYLGAALKFPTVGCLMPNNN